MRFRSRFLLASGASVAALALLASCATPADDTGPTSIVIGVPFLGVSNDPLNYGHLIFLEGQQVYESLFWFNQETETLEPLLAEEISLSDDRKTLALKLREDVDFTDGVHMDAAGMETFLTAMFASETYLWGAGARKIGMKVTATGEYTIELTTTAPMRRDFLFTLSLSQIASPLAIEDPEALAETAAGSGPYIVDELVPEASVSFVRNPDYRDPEAFDFDTVTLKVFADNIAALNALKSGQIDATAIDLSYAREAEASGFELHEIPGRFATLVFMDKAGDLVPALADVRVRQAMNMAFDRDAIAETVDYGFGFASSQAANSIQPEYVADGDDRYPYDPEAAKQLLAEAGYPDGFEITIPTGPGLNPQNATGYNPIVLQSLADIGITVTFDVLQDEAAMFEAMESGQYPVVVLKTRTPTQSFNPESEASIFDERGLELWSIITEGSIADSNAAAAELGEYMLEEAWFVPFSRTPVLWATVAEITVVPGIDDPRFSSFELVD